MRLLAFGAILLTSVGACGIATGETQPPPGLFDGRDGPLLKRFSSEREFRRYMETALGRTRRESTAMYDISPPALSVSNAPAAQASAPANPEITNNQTTGVDEGGIVKQIGRYLVILQDGRLFSVDTGGDAGAPLRRVDRVDVYRSTLTAADWYDEMLVLGDRILVTAYNYREGASEITVLRMAPDGRMRREGRYLLSSNDYYSTENYATRLVGDSLVFYAPIALDSLAADPRRGPIAWPRLRRADGDGPANAGEALIRATDVYAAPGKVDWPVLHTIAICPLRGALDCRTSAFVGPAMREFYVSPTDAFLWLGAPDGLPWAIDYGNRRRQGCGGDDSLARYEAALLYRLPLQAGPVGAVAVDGFPADQFAFDSKDGRFRALLQKAGDCAARTADLALLDLPLSAFGTRLRHVGEQAYTTLPPFEGGQLENRFVGDWLVYGGRADWSSMAMGPSLKQSLGSTLFAVPLARPAATRRLDLPHNAIRIERAGGDAVVTGYRGAEGLSLSYVRLDRQGPAIASTATLEGRFESENRSHAFNAWVKPAGDGVIGLPTTGRVWRSGRGWSDSESSDLSFIAIGRDKSLASAGALSVHSARAPASYRCEVSCVDWYGNSRPIFTGGRIFALMGTELVEGRLSGGRIAEFARVDLTRAGDDRVRPAR